MRQSNMRTRGSRLRSPIVSGPTVLCAAALAALAGCDEPPHAASRRTIEQPAIYGHDDRVEVYAHDDPSAVMIASASAVALIPYEYLDRSSAPQVHIVAPSLGDSHRLCPGSRFAEQPSAADCSGALIDSDLVLTAGHCVPSLSACRSMGFVFGYHYTDQDVLNPLTEDDVFACSQIVVRSDWPDYAVVRLDRPATPRFSPLPIKQGDFALRPGEPLRMIGFPSGIPAKIDDGGRVIDPRDESLDHFVATTDSFGGNSGSPVLDARQEVVGILVRGASDFWWQNGCWSLATYPEGGGGDGEEVTYVARALSALCNVVPDAAPCDDAPTSWCSSCVESEACPSGWVCSPSDGVCGVPCTQDLDCRVDHHCSRAIGVCVPKRSTVCDGDDLIELDACGKQVRIVEHCVAGCADAACLDACANSCEPGEERCRADGLLERCVEGAEVSGLCPGWGAAVACADGASCNDPSCVATDAWCESCSVTAPCPAGWSCGESGTCRRSCVVEGDCREDHDCNLALGQCEPKTLAVCEDGVASIVDVCGSVLEQRSCEANSICFEGECVEAPTERCVEDDRACAGDHTVLRCARLDAVGSTAWREHERCAPDRACRDGGCVLRDVMRPPLDVDLTPTDVVHATDVGPDSGSPAEPTEAGAWPRYEGGGGCAAVSPAQRGSVPAAALAGIALGALLLSARRRRSR